MSRDQVIPVASVIITVADLAVALIAGIVIFPIVFSFGLVPTIGAELAFSTPPKAFAVMPGGWLFAAAFFLVLFFAALTSAISMLEVSVAAIRESVCWSRNRAAVVLTGAVIIISLPSALSYSAMDLRIGGIRMLDFMDETVGTLGLPIAALLLAVVITWFLPRTVLADEIGETSARLIHPLCRFVIPAILIVTTAARLLSGLDYPGMRNLPGSEFIGTLLQAEGVFTILIVIIGIILAFCWIRSCPLTDRFRSRK